MTTTTDSLQQAISHLGAVEVAPGRYAWQTKTQQTHWVVTSAKDLERLSAYLDHERATDLDWLAQSDAVEMPAWWTPERRYAVISKNGVTCPGPSKELCRASGACALVVTADLSTGEEVPA
jgi:hypothetical protein